MFVLVGFNDFGMFWEKNFSFFKNYLLVVIFCGSFFLMGLGSKVISWMWGWWSSVGSLRREKNWSSYLWEGKVSW